MNRNKRAIMAMVVGVGVLSTAALSFGMMNNNDGEKAVINAEIQAMELANSEEGMPSIEQPIFDMVIYQGEVIEIMEMEDGIAYLIEKDGEQILFKMPEGSETITDLNDIAVGDSVEVYYDGILTRSIPAQGTAADIVKLDGAEVTENTKFYVADAAMYRGEVVDVITSENGDTSIVLEQVEGRDYGHEQIVFNLDEYTRINGELEDIQVGDYLEVFYGGAMTSSVVPHTGAIAINKLMPADIVVFNGEVNEIVFNDDDKTEGYMLMTDLSTDMEIVFHFGEGTQIYMNIDEIKPGDKLNILHSGAVAMSMPPQGSALEIAPYTAAE